ncbi:multiheme c-type cytochrome [Novipirellula artificiosorum]|uniref:Perchlorate reductase subunit gamma n=1 Tax=Novipirellula artificiosorum TaxID=2528016 RepID=A0A5C6DM50_9BACT|nr:multiheme c-type cytochrome [Novipirellula artificiosorum]TWU35996.1 Perchlorate reductase subunit gamma precursor [Novipirellula artificiosorum]
MSTRITTPTSLLILIWGVAALSSANGQDKHPVYVGGAVCAECHSGPSMGHQFSKWLQSKHAQAYASLAKPEAREITELSGIPIEPQKSTLCLGCHTTGVRAEDWEKDPTFVAEDGIQCERCHGPGSEYANMDTMTDRRAAREAGLMMPSGNDCMGCHRAKGSHDAVLGPNHFDLAQALQDIHHPTPDDWTVEASMPTPDFDHASVDAMLTGSVTCAKCHEGPDQGQQFSKWTLSGHARSYATLSTPRAYEIAAEKGIDNPQENEDCLSCHTTAFHTPASGALDSFRLSEGVGCEACHGAGSEHVELAASATSDDSILPRLPKATEQSCRVCHAGAHGKTFDFQTALNKIAHPKTPEASRQPIRYKTPLNMAISPSGEELYVACEASDTVIVIDTETQKRVAEIAVGGQPHDVTFAPSGATAYVSNRLEDSVSEIDVRTRTVCSTFPVGDEPHGLLTDREGQTLFVLNTSSGTVSVVDTQTRTIEKTLAASRNPWSLALSPDGSHVAITNNLSRFVPFRHPSQSEVTRIHTATHQIDQRDTVVGANLMMGIDWHPSGRFALATNNRSKNLVPMTRLLQGWTLTNGLAIIWADGRIDQVLLDEPNLCFPDPTDVAITPDGKWALVTSSGSDRVAVVDIHRMIEMLENASDDEREHVFPNHLGKPTEFVVASIPTGISPRGVVVSADGSTAYVANCLDDSVTVIDVASRTATATIDLGGPKQITLARKGERLFHSADITFHRQFSCHSCHPDGHVDGVTYDIEPDGIGISPVDNRTLRGILDTAPFKWEGTNPSLKRQCGPRLSVFFTRIEPFTPEQLEALDYYICTIPRPPNRYRPLGAPLTEAQRRGKGVFEREKRANGSPIPKDRRCVTCHFPPLYTDRSLHNVGTQMPSDRDAEFDTPHLNNIYDSAPYLHNGIAPTLEEIWTRYNPHDQHGVTNDLTKDQLNDLIEYLNTL